MLNIKLVIIINTLLQVLLVQDNMKLITKEINASPKNILIKDTSKTCEPQIIRKVISNKKVNIKIIKKFFIKLLFNSFFMVPLF